MSNCIDHLESHKGLLCSYWKSCDITKATVPYYNAIILYIIVHFNHVH